jgi:hypothetical protein
MSETEQCRVRVRHYMDVLEEDMRKLRQDVDHLTLQQNGDVHDYVMVFCHYRSIIDAVKILRTMSALQMNAELPATAAMISANLVDVMPVLLELENLAELAHDDIAEVIEKVAEKPRRKKRQ